MKRLISDRNIQKVPFKSMYIYTPEYVTKFAKQAVCTGILTHLVRGHQRLAFALDQGHWNPVGSIKEYIHITPEILI